MILLFAMDFNTPYLTEQIIAYIGNKRKLLNLIYEAMVKLDIEIKPGLKFFDAFSGSGVVARFAKSLNFEVYANDWEYYSKVINTAYLSVDKKDIKKIFGSEKAFLALLAKINSLPPPKKSEQFIAQYYAPKEDDIDSVDYRTERLFFTRQNALAIDKIRNYIEENFPESSRGKNKQKARSLLTAMVVYEAATHNNTSGVFKAFHKEFGGHGKDALKRITAPIELHEPVLIDSDYPCHVFHQDTNELVKELKGFDVAYLDPPYNQHQYGSNYFMLNTIARWDGVAIPLNLNAKGILKEKAGIRHDWVNTKSPYCYKEKAEIYFRELIQNLDSRYILISYSTDGIISFENMCRICMSKGLVSIVTNEYTTYRGGKQSNNRQNADIEFILCIDTAKKSNKQSEKEIQSIFLRKKLSLLFKQKYCKAKLKKNGLTLHNNTVTVKLGSKELCITTDNYFTLTEPAEAGKLSQRQADRLYSVLSACTCQSKEEELKELIDIAKKTGLKNKHILKAIPHTLKKLASKKNQPIFYTWLKKIESLQSDYPQIYDFISADISKLKSIAETRFTT